MGPVTRSSRRPCLALAFLLAVSSGARGDYRSSYESGIRAMDQKDWPAAVRAFQAAARDKSAEGGQILIYGMRYRPYLPHYYLGIAYSNLGNCEAALAEWKESESQGAIRSTGEVRELARYRAQCEARVAALGPKPAATATQAPVVARSVPTPIVRPPAPSPTSAVRIAQRIEPRRAPPPPPRVTAPASGQIARARGEAQARLQAAESAAARFALLREQPNASPVWQSDSGLRRQDEKARRTLDAARVLLGKSVERGDLPGFGRVQQMASDADRQFAALSRSLAERVAQARIQLETEDRLAASRELEARRAEARTLLAQLPRSAAGGPLRQAREELQGVLAQLEKTASDRSSEQLRQIAGDLARRTASLRLLARPAPPPPALLAGASAFFGGDYVRAARILESETFQDPRAAAQARLLVAASRYSAWVLGGSADARLRDQAAGAARECARLDVSLVLDSRAFSPRFVEFFRKERGTAEGAPGSPRPTAKAAPDARARSRPT